MVPQLLFLPRGRVAPPVCELVHCWQCAKLPDTHDRGEGCGASTQPPDCLLLTACACQRKLQGLVTNSIERASDSKRTNARTNFVSARGGGAEASSYRCTRKPPSKSPSCLPYVRDCDWRTYAPTSRHGKYVLKRGRSVGERSERIHE